MCFRESDYHTREIFFLFRLGDEKERGVCGSG